MGKFKNITDLQADEKIEEEGVDLNFGKGRVITIRRAAASNRKYKTAMARTFKPHQKIGGTLTVDDETAEQLLKEVYAESIVVGWSGFMSAEGKEIPFSKNNCVELFMDAPEVFNHVKSESSKFSNFAKGDVQEAGK